MREINIISNEKQEFTEKELITLLNSRGIPTPQVESSFYKKKGYFNTGRELESFMRSAKQLFSEVELKINPNSRRDKEGNKRAYSGKKRIYVVKGQFNEPIEKVDLRKDNGYLPPKTRLKIGNYIYSLVKEKGYFNGSPLELRKALGLDIPPQNFSFRKELELIFGLKQKGAPSFYRLYELSGEIVKDIRISSDKVILQELNRMHSEGVLSFREYFINDFKEEIQEEELQEFKLLERELYNKYIGKTHLNSELKNFGEYKFNKYSLNERKGRLKWRLNKINSKSERIRKNHLFGTEDGGLKSKDEEVDNLQNRIALQEEIGKAILNINKELKQEFGFTEYNIMYNIKITKNSPDFQIEEDGRDINYHFRKYFTEKTKTYRYLNYEDYYRHSTFFWRRFYYFTVTELFSMRDTEVYSLYLKDIGQYIRDYHEQFASRGKTIDEREKRIKEETRRMKQGFLNSLAENRDFSHINKELDRVLSEQEGSPVFERKEYSLYDKALQLI